jgi:hypothetical protein
MAEGDGVSAEHQKLMDDIVYLRGRVITAYAQVEFLLADIAVKLELKFPYLISKRLKAAKRIAERAGYESYRDELIAICDGLAEHDETRNFLAHFARRVWKWQRKLKVNSYRALI